MLDTILFEKKDTTILHLKGVFFGDAGSGKSHIAKDFIVKSAEHTGNKKAILIDTENGWNWLKNEMNDIDILEPNIDWLNKNNIDIVALFEALYKQTVQEPVSSVVIDSATHIGELIYLNALNEVNERKAKIAKAQNKPFYPQTELAYQDWSYFNEKSDIVIAYIKKMACNVALCGRATSEVMMEGKTLKTATERTLQGWKKLTYEFDFACLLDPEIDLTQKDGFKKFQTYVVKSRFADDGKVLTGNSFLNKWFSYFEKFDYEKLKANILETENDVEFQALCKKAVAFKNQMKDNQTKELRNIIENKKKALIDAKLENNN